MVIHSFFQQKLTEDLPCILHCFGHWTREWTKLDHVLEELNFSEKKKRILKLSLKHYNWFNIFHTFSANAKITIIRVLTYSGLTYPIAARTPVWIVKQWTCYSTPLYVRLELLNYLNNQFLYLFSVINCEMSWFIVHFSHIQT